MPDPESLSEASVEEPPRDVAEYLARLESRTTARIVRAAHGLGESTCAATRLREHVRAHPLLATAASAFLGAALAPLLVRALAGAGRARGVLSNRGASLFGSVVDTALRQALARTERNSSA